MHTETLTELTFEDLGSAPAIGEQQPESGLAAARGVILGCFLGGVIWAVIGCFLSALI